MNFGPQAILVFEGKHSLGEGSMNEEGRDEVVFERLLADRETPFTDFHVEDSEGEPRAVFDRLTPEQSSLLAHFLYPDESLHQRALSGQYEGRKP